MEKHVKSLLIIAGCIFASFAISNKVAYAADDDFPDQVFADSVYVDEDDFPDPVFAQSVLSAYNRVNEVQAASVDKMTVDGLSKITELGASIRNSASGIEKLTGLTLLTVRQDLGIQVGEVGLQRIDLSKNTSLRILSIRSIPDLDTVIFPNSSSLERFEIFHCESLKELDLSTYDNLNLISIYLLDNGINSLVLPKNTSKLETIRISWNNIETLDLSSLSDNFIHARFMYTDSLKQIILPANWENNPDRDLEATLQFSPEELRDQITITYAKKPATDEDVPEKKEENEKDTTKVPNTGVGITDMANKIAIYITPFIFGIFIISRRAYKANKKRVRFSR